MYEEFLDDNGHLLGSWYQLRSTLGCNVADDVLGPYVVKMGFVWLRHGTSGMEIRLRPPVVAPRALVALLYKLEDNPHHRLVVSTWDDRWSHRIVRDAAEPRPWLLKLLRAAERRIEVDFFIARPSATVRDASLGKLVQFRRRASGAGSVSELSDLCRDTFGERFTLARPIGDDRFVIEAIGPGYGFVNNRWRNRAVGLAFEDCPDMRYGRWIAQSMYRVLRNGETSFESVDAMVAQPLAGRQRFRYDRLVAVIERPDGGPLVLTSSAPNHGVDLRVGLG